MNSFKFFCRITQLSLVLLLGGVLAAPAFQLGGRPAAEWIQTLERPQRIEGLKIDEIITSLKLKPGMVVADIGSGSGVLSRPLAKSVAPNGKVIAVDIDAGLLSYVKERAMKENIPNIETHLGEVDDAVLPGQIVDLAFIHDVLHHIEHRDVYLKNLAKYIKPGGRIVVIDLDSTDPQNSHREQPEMIITKEQVNQWMAAAGLKLVEEVNLFPGKKIFLVFGKQETAAAPAHNMEEMGDDMDDMPMD